jgi:hypothetical protein
MTTVVKARDSQPVKQYPNFIEADVQQFLHKSKLLVSPSSAR